KGALSSGARFKALRLPNPRRGRSVRLSFLDRVAVTILHEPRVRRRAIVRPCRQAKHRQAEDVAAADKKSNWRFLVKPDVSPHGRASPLDLFARLLRWGFVPYKDNSCGLSLAHRRASW